jgi:hypothetical protein
VLCFHDYIILIKILFKKDNAMPIKRKICKIGSGFAVFLPKSWILLLEEKHGSIEAVTMEVDGKIIISPILGGKETND